MGTMSQNESFTSIKPKVEFLDLQDKYTYKEDLLCKYSLTDYISQEGDRIAIFKLGWSYIKDYVLFEWAPVTIESNNVVTFSKLSLPKDTNDMYQFCYITSENEVHGASSLFQFCENTTHVEKTKKTKEQTSCSSKLIKQLQEENFLLKESLKAVLLQKKHDDNYSKNINELKYITQHLKEVLNFQQKEIDNLKQTVAENCKVIKKLSIEKATVQVKYEQLKSKTNENDFDIGELQSIPPFPFPK